MANFDERLYGFDDNFSVTSKYCYNVINAVDYFTYDPVFLTHISYIIKKYVLILIKINVMLFS